MLVPSGSDRKRDEEFPSRVEMGDGSGLRTRRRRACDSVGIESLAKDRVGDGVEDGKAEEPCCLDSASDDEDGSVDAIMISFHPVSVFCIYLSGLSECRGRLITYLHDMYRQGVEKLVRDKHSVHVLASLDL